MGTRVNPAVIGAFVVGAVVILIASVVLFGSGRLFRTTYPYIIYFTGDVNGLRVGAPVKFKGVELGAVAKILLSVGDPVDGSIGVTAFRADDVRIPVIIELDEQAMQQRGAQIAPDPETIERLIGYGLRAELSMESFVTGVLYVKLDIDPSSEPQLVADRSVPYVEIPSRPTRLEEVERKAALFLARLDQLDVEGLIEGLNSTVRGIDALVNAPALGEAIEALPQLGQRLDATVAELGATAAEVRKLAAEFGPQSAQAIASLQDTADRAGRTLDTASATLEAVTSVVSEDSPLLYQLGRSLEDLAHTTRAVRRIAEDMERNPAVLLRGRTTEPAK